MTEERNKHRRPGTFSDERDRRRTPPSGVPAPEIDPEPTPPPQDPPKPESIAGFTLIPAEIREQFKQLSASVVDLTQASQRTWDNRHNNARIDRMEQSLTANLQDNAAIGALLHDFVMPGLKASMARIDVLLTHHEGSKVRQEVFYEQDWPRFTKSFELLVDRIGRIERTQDRQETDMRVQGERFASTHGVLVARVNATEQVANAHAMQISVMGTRATALERVNEDVKLQTEAVSKSERRRMGWISAFIAGVIASLGAIINAIR